MEIIPIDVIPLITNYLKSIDVYNLYLTCTFCHQNVDIKPSIIREINTRLSLIFGDRLVDFKESMKRSKCIISGSFILQSILGEKWEDSDIDIFSLVDDNGLLDVEVFMYNEMQVRYNTGNVDDYMMGSEIYWVRDYDNTIQIIGVLREYMQEEISNLDDWFNGKTLHLSDIDLLKRFMDESSDFSICKNLYYYDGKDNLILNNLEEIFTKTTDFRKVPSSPPMLSIRRYHKYKKRGFTFRNKDLLTYNNLRIYNSWQISVTLNQIYTNPVNEIIKFFGDDNFEFYQQWGHQVDKESECSNDPHPNCFPNDNMCYPESCVVRFLNPNLRHTHSRVVHIECAHEYDDRIIIL